MDPCNKQLPYTRLQFSVHSTQFNSIFNLHSMNTRVRGSIFCSSFHVHQVSPLTEDYSLPSAKLRNLPPTHKRVTRYTPFAKPATTSVTTISNQPGHRPSMPHCCCSGSRRSTKPPIYRFSPLQAGGRLWRRRCKNCKSHNTPRVPAYLPITRGGLLNSVDAGSHGMEIHLSAPPEHTHTLLVDGHNWPHCVAFRERHTPFGTNSGVQLQLHTRAEVYDDDVLTETEPTDVWCGEIVPCRNAVVGHASTWPREIQREGERDWPPEPLIRRKTDPTVDRRPGWLRLCGGIRTFPPTTFFFYGRESAPACISFDKPNLKK